MANYGNGYYRFSDGNYYLQAGESSVGLATTASGGQNQFWHLENGNLKSELSSSRGLAGTSSVTLSTSPATVTVVEYSENKCYIKNTVTGKYLYRSSGSLSWSTNKTYWTIERVFKQTGVPKYDPEYFSEKSNMSDGTWNTYWTTYLKNFFVNLYGPSTTPIDCNNIGNCMYGAIYGSGPYQGKFHTGLDFWKGGTSVVKCPFTGEYLGCDEDYGCVYVYDQNTNCTFVFMHMDIANRSAYNINIKNKEPNTPINKNTPMGLESTKAGNETVSQHLHIEVHPGRVTEYAPIPAKSYTDIESIIPYGAIYQVL